MNADTTTLGDLITAFYREYLEIYGDRELASVATAVTINELLDAKRRVRQQPRAKAA